jgi:hypothetical protein
MKSADENAMNYSCSSIEATRALTHIATEQALSCLDMNAKQQATQYFEFAVTQLRHMANELARSTSHS